MKDRLNKTENIFSSYLHPVELKLTLMVLQGVLLILRLVMVFFMGIRGSLLVVFLLSLIFRLLWLLNFMELYMSLNKLKRWVLLVYGLNVILSWFVLYLILELTFLEFFIIGGTLVLLSGLRFFTFFVKRMHVLTSLLTYGLFIENNFIGIIGFHLVFS